jgi:tryptophanyl-tRNA synthetase
MPTDPARVRRTDPGNPDICPVWQLHGVYSSDTVKAEVREGCTTAGIGCLDCKQYIIDSVLQELEPIQERASEFEQDPGRVRAIMNEGSDAARDVARETLEEVRGVMGLNYS